MFRNSTFLKGKFWTKEDQEGQVQETVRGRACMSVTQKQRKGTTSDASDQCTLSRG